MKSIDIRVAEQFPEPEFSRLQMRVFEDVQQYSEEWDSILREEADHGISPQKVSPCCASALTRGMNSSVGLSAGWSEATSSIWRVAAFVHPIGGAESTRRY